MTDVKEIQSSLNSNPYLTDDIKECFMELITIFHNNFPEVDLLNLKERLKDLNIIKGSRFLVKGSSYYDPTNNQLFISASQLDDTIDVKHLFMRELLNIISAKENFTGFNQDNSYEALNIGYTEILANYLVGNECECEYEDEIIATNMLATVIGSDTLFNAYFNNDVSLIMNVVC